MQQAKMGSNQTHMGCQVFLVEFAWIFMQLHFSLGSEHIETLYTQLALVTQTT